MSLGGIEEEVIFLRAIKEIIDSMVNFEMLRLLGEDPDSEIRFKSSTHQRLFNIVLVDFLSQSDPRAPVRQTSYLGALKAISEQPHFNVDNSIAALRNATHVFTEWLQQEVLVDVWLPSIDTNADVLITRTSFLKMCGNISKHNVLRLVRVAEELKRTLEAGGHNVELADAMVALDDFYERFHSDILNYHGSTIAAFLNDIRWSIYEYLQPEFHRSIVWDREQPLLYRYTYPVGAEHDLAKRCYWDLMNEVRTQPYMRRFEVTKWLKLRY